MAHPAKKCPWALLAFDRALWGGKGQQHPTKRKPPNSKPTSSEEEKKREDIATMSNPITAWIKSGMETYSAREAWMEERVSE